MIKNKMKVQRHNKDNEASKIHDEVKEKCIKIMGDSESGSILKACLYNHVKLSNPELNNLQKAKELEKVVEDKAVLDVCKNKDNVEKFKKIIEEAKERKLNKGVKTVSTKEKKEAKPKKEKAIKVAKRSKKSKQSKQSKKSRKSKRSKKSRKSRKSKK